jgi:hypothetical protein
MRTKSKFTIIGNCQVDSISKYLLSSSDFSSEFEYFRVPPIHTINVDEQKAILNELKTCELIILQPVVDFHRFPYLSSEVIEKEALSSCKIIRIPSAYYNGYFPFYDSLDGVVGTIGGVHDFQVINCFLKGLTSNETINILENGREIPFNKIQNQHLMSIQNLHRRELDYNLDVKISSFIIDNFQEKRLFHTFNHPTPEVFKYISNQILKLCGLSPEESSITKDYLGHIALPIDEMVASTLGLSFKQQAIIKDKVIINIEDQVIKDYSLYKELDISFLRKMLLTKKRFLLN